MFHHLEWNVNLSALVGLYLTTKRKELKIQIFGPIFFLLFFDQIKSLECPVQYVITTHLFETTELNSRLSGSYIQGQFCFKSLPQISHSKSSFCQDLSLHV